MTVRSGVYIHKECLPGILAEHDYDPPGLVAPCRKCTDHRDAALCVLRGLVAKDPANRGYGVAEG